MLSTQSSAACKGLQAGRGWHGAYWGSQIYILHWSWCRLSCNGNCICLGKAGTLEALKQDAVPSVSASISRHGLLPYWPDVRRCTWHMLAESLQYKLRVAESQSAASHGRGRLTGGFVACGAAEPQKFSGLAKATAAGTRNDTQTWYFCGATCRTTWYLCGSSNAPPSAASTRAITSAHTQWACTGAAASNVLRTQ